MIDNIKNWESLVQLLQGQKMLIEKVRLESGVVMEGPFEAPPLMSLSFEDQVFVMAFLRVEGSIKEIEKLFGISYPSVKNRLKKITAKIPLIEVSPKLSAKEVLEKLESGEIKVEDALKLLQGAE